MASSQHKLQNAADLHRAGNLAEAERLYTDILNQDKRNVHALSLLGTLYLQMGQAERAMPYLQKAHAIDARSAEFASNVGAAYHHMGKMEEAIKYYRLAVRNNPNYAEANNNLGAALLQAGRAAEGVPFLETAIRLNPDYPQAQLNIAKAYRAGGMREKAIHHFTSAFRLTPTNGDIIFLLGTMLREENRFDEAIAHYQNALRHSPNDHRLKNNLGNLWRESGRPDQALPFYAEALCAAPKYTDAYINQGAAQQDLNQLEEAQASYTAALQLDPQSAAATINLGSLCLRQGRATTARDHYQRALELDPTSINAQWNLGLASLALGDYARGWALYERGFGPPDKRGQPPFSDDKKWRGEDLSGKQLLLWGEQGLGDQLQFVRYASVCKALGAEVSALVAKPMLNILATHPALTRVLEKATPEDFDYHIAMMSLPHQIGTTVETIPADTPYLFATESYRTKWQGKLPTSNKFKVGLVWAGNAREGITHANLIDRRRSMSLNELLPLLDIDGVDFYSLQMGKQAEQIDALNLRDRIIDPMGDVKDFMDTAAIIEQLDLVISVDTSVVHLTGALGKPVWVLSRLDACWRWLGNREYNPWYPTARVFGQTTMGDWSQVVTTVRDALRHHITAKN